MTTDAPTAQANLARLKEGVLVATVSLVAAVPLWLGPGMVNTRSGGDSPFLLVRVHQLVASIQSGAFPARWMPNAAYGLGFPFFQFYASLPYYIAAAFKLMGFGYIASIQMAQTLGFVLAALAIYGYGRELRFGRWASFAAAVAYSFAPFHMVNIYVRGDSLSEFYAFAFYPLIAWCLLRLQRLGRPREVGWAALSFAGLWLTHNLSAMMFSPFAAGYVLWLTWEAAEHRWRTCSRGALALALGLAASAWFWLPVLAERSFVALQDMTTGYFHFAAHFRGWDLLQPSLWFDYSITALQQPFRMGLLQAILALAGLLAAIVGWVRHPREGKAILPAALLFILSTAMITPLTRTLWERVPLLPLVQFPWRFLSIQAFGASLMVAALVVRIGREKTTAVALSGLVMLSALVALQPERLAIQEEDVSLQRLMEYEYFTANIGTTIRADYLPRWVDPRPFTSQVLFNEGIKPTPLVLEGSLATASLLGQDASSEQWQVEASSASLLAFHTYFLPGWVATVDEQPALAEPVAGLGFLGLRVGPGVHDIRLTLRPTAIQIAAQLVSVLTIIGLLATIGQRARTSRRLVLVLLASAGLVAVAALGARGAPPIPDERKGNWYEASSEPLDLTMDFERIPYLHHNPNGLRFGETVRLQRYWLPTRDLRAGEMMTLTTEWQHLLPFTSVEIAVVSPAAHLFGVSLSVAAETLALNQPSLAHTLAIPPETPDGIYLVTVRAYDGSREMRPLTERGELLGTTYLVPIRIRGISVIQPSDPSLQQFGDVISLQDARIEQRTAGSIHVELDWSTNRTPSQNYKIAFRLHDATGWEVARLDTEPGYGFLPTSTWREGQVIHDRYVLPLDEGTPPASAYTLDITLYEASSLRPIGTARIPGIAVTLPSVRSPSALLQGFGAFLGLQSASLQKDAWQPGDRLELLATWIALLPPERDLECQISLLDPAGTEVARETAPLAPEYPTSQWPQHAMVSSRLLMALPVSLTPGRYGIKLAVRDQASEEELGSILLPQTVNILPSQRSFTVPEMGHTVGATFEGQVRLLGYDLQQNTATVVLTLHWQAITSMGNNYKVFVHLFDPSTETIVAQRDVLAGGDTAPTSTWVPQQVLSNRVELLLDKVPAGGYSLAIGLYHPDGRLRISAPDAFTVSSDRLILDQGIRIP